MARCMERSVSRSTTGAELDVVRLALDTACEDVHFAFATRVAERRAQEEAIELRLGKRVRPLVLDRVLRRDDEEGRLEDVRDAFDRHLPLLHRLEQRRLRLRRGAVDLVREEEVREDRARPELEVAVALVPDRRARHVRRHEVGRELDAREPHAQNLRERARGERLREAGVVLEQDVSVREEAEPDELERARACRRPPSRPRRAPRRRAPEPARAPSHALERVDDVGELAWRDSLREPILGCAAGPRGRAPMRPRRESRAPPPASPRARRFAASASSPAASCAQAWTRR